MAIATLILTMAVATVSATTDVKNEKKDTGISIESKEKKVSSYKVTWNANGGKIGSKKTKVTTVKRGSKIGKLAATPKRSEYTFKGWYTKKSGGKKISKATKPSKSVTYFAQWKKKSRALNAEEKKLVGIWGIEWDGSSVFTFNKDGTFNYVAKHERYDYGMRGKYSLKNGVLTLEYSYSYDYGDGWETWLLPKNPSKYEGDRGVKFSTISGKQAFTYGFYRPNDVWFIKDRIGMY